MEHFSGSDFGVKTKKYFFSIAKAMVEKYFNVLAQKRPALRERRLWPAAASRVAYVANATPRSLLLASGSYSAL